MKSIAIRTILVLLSSIAAAASGAAQPAPPSGELDKLLDQFQQDRLRLVETSAGFEAQQKLSVEFAATLEEFLGRAKGMDRFNARLMLVDYSLSLGKRDKAVSVLTALDSKAAPALTLASAAEFAKHLQLDDQREAWIEAALAKAESFENRMALGMHLMTRLEEVERGERLFEQAFKQADGDEQRAKVRWYQAAALREREDLHGDEYADALRALAEQFGDTYYGSVAGDRLRARDFKVGAKAVPLTLRTLDGKSITLADLAGKVVALHFWATWNGPCEAAAPHLAALHRKYRDRGFSMVGISFDQDPALVKQVAAAHQAIWPQVCDAKGRQTDAALRYNIDGPPRLILIGRDGKIAALSLYPFDAASAADIDKAVEAALAKRP